jgi:putative phage-type endonuclease
MPMLKLEYLSEEWFAARKGKVTASLAAACLNVGPNGWLSAFNAITDTTQRAPTNWQMRWGIEHEQHARADYEVETGHLVWPGWLWIHQDHPWLSASPDGLVGTEGVVEIKCPQTLPTAVPPHHEIQCRIQLACTDRFWCDYFAWGQSGHFLHRIKRDLTIETDLLARLEAFWKTYIKPGIPPPRRKPA